MLLYRSGLRVSEALALKPSGIDLQAGGRQAGGAILGACDNLSARIGL